MQDLSSSFYDSSIHQAQHSLNRLSMHNFLVNDTPFWFITQPSYKQLAVYGGQNASPYSYYWIAGWCTTWTVAPLIKICFLLPA